MGRLVRLVFRGFLFLTALLAGCNKPVGQCDYGIVMPAMPPTIVLTDLTYQPPGPIRVGDNLTLLATTSQPDSGARVSVHAWPVDEEIVLQDDGKPPDSLALDGIWTAPYTWPLDAEPTGNAYFRAHLELDDTYRPQSTSTPYFEVLPTEDSAS
jgi:hypothetical protein